VKPLEPFVYSDEQWARMETIVSRAGGDAARGKLNAQRRLFERAAAGWRERHRRWNGRALSPADAAAYKRIGALTRELIEVFDGLSKAATNDRLLFPAILAGHGLIWEGLAELRENRARFANFLDALDHTARRAEQIAQFGPNRSLLASRHKYIADLGRVWRTDLGLKITTGTKALFTQFVEAASKGVYQFPNAGAAADAIVNSMKSWPRRPGCKNDAENN
jgi:hypothetical protein